MIDWEAIWETHAPHFSDGESKIPLPNGKILRLKAGPGFGDLSHPTTILSLSLIKPDMPICIDIGTGTGILAIAMALLGAKKVYAFEIDLPSIKHAKENIVLNNLTDQIIINSKTPPKNFDQLALNMIYTEQAQALRSNPFANTSDHYRIVSGVLLEHENTYLENFNHGTLLTRKEQDGWLAYAFDYKKEKK